MRPRHRSVLALLALIAALPAGAQSRVVERHSIGDPEGRLMGYYAASVAFSPLGAPVREAPWTITGALELSYVPPLDAEQRSLGGSKTESTNLAPAFPRPRLRLALPRGLVAEASWVPPVRAFEVTANLVGVSLASAGWRAGGVTLAPRLAFSTGRVTGAVTCNDDLSDHGGGDSLYYERICFGNESEDRFEPTAWSGEVIASRVMREGRLRPWLALGARRERTRFDVGVICTGSSRCPDGGRDPINPILEMHSTRGFASLGATWLLRARTAVAAEMFYVPGSLVTGRVLGSWRLLGAGAAR